jgi:filamentous hemagglutinin family protein
MFERFLNKGKPMKRLIDFSSRFRILKGGKVSLVVSALIGSVTLSFASPTGGTVTSGSASISQNGTVTNITQSTQKASINWQNFSIASNETVNFNQPNSSSITLNRVIGNERSVINGALNANGQVWLLNSNGVLFGKNASINTAGLLATTAKLSDADFQNGNYKFKNTTSNSVINEGTIIISDSGSVILASNEVRNSGVMKAVKGKVHLIGADSYSLNLNGNSLVNLKVDKGVLDALVKNSGHIIADGGEIYLTTNVVNELLKGVVNNTGIIEANSLDGLMGKVELFAHGGKAQIGGTIKAHNGFVETSGKYFEFLGADIQAGHWLIDPVDITIDSTLATAIEAALGNGDVSITTDGSNTPDTSSGESGTTGDIIVASAITWSTAQKLTLDAANNIFINAAITASHANGQLALHYGDSGDYYLNSVVNLQAGDNFFTKQASDGGETTWTVVTTATNLESIALDSNSVLGADLDASGIVNWTPIGNDSTKFTGNIDGLGHTIDGLTIDDNTLTRAGLFGETNGATIKNIGLTNVNISATKQYARVGGLIGHNGGTTVSNSYTTGNITGGYDAYVGGLVGYNTGGSTIEYTYSAASVIGDGRTGGLVGDNVNSNNFIKNSYATGSVTTGGTGGGLVGRNYGGTISNSYATGSVTAGGGMGMGFVQGLVGSNVNNGTVENSFWDTETSGVSADDNIDGTEGLTTAEFANSTIFTEGANWATYIWGFGTPSGGATVKGYEVGQGYPYLKTIKANIQTGNQKTTLFADGFGTSDDPYEITSWTQLQNINNSNILTQGYYFSLLNDLSSSTSDYTDIASSSANSGKGWNPIGNGNSYFSGEFDGLDHTIDSLTITDTADSFYFGLFGTADSNAIIKNIGITNVDIASNRGNINAIGALVGESTATISNSFSTGTISVASSTIVGGLVGGGDGDISSSYSTVDVEGSDYTGGLVGYVWGGSISNSYATGDISSTGDDIGGLAGKVTSPASITKSYATGIVIGYDNIGGLVGSNSGSIENSYATSSVSIIPGGSNAGGLVGFDDTGSVTNSFWNTNTSGQATSDGGEGKTTAELQDITIYSDAGWDIALDSTLNSEYKYPVLVTEEGVTSWKIYSELTPEPEVPDVEEPTPIPDPTPTPEPEIPDVEDPTPTPTPDPDPTPTPETPNVEEPTPQTPQEKQAEKIKDIVTPIINGTRTVVNTPQVKIPQTATPAPRTQIVPNNLGLGNNARIVSTTTTGEQADQIVSLGELQQANGGAGEVRVPLSDNSIVDLVNGGVNLPNGVDQQFFVVTEEN